MRRVLRLGLPALAVYALVLQAFMTGASPAAAFDPSTLLCAEWSAGHDQPAPGQPAGQHHHGLCAAPCGAPAFSGLIGGAATAGPLIRIAQIASKAPVADDRGPTLSRHRGPGARAPPQA
jgi:hypothetical protein